MELVAVCGCMKGSVGAILRGEDTAVGTLFCSGVERCSRACECRGLTLREELAAWLIGLVLLPSGANHTPAQGGERPVGAWDAWMLDVLKVQMMLSSLAMSCPWKGKHPTAVEVFTQKWHMWPMPY